MTKTPSEQGKATREDVLKAADNTVNGDRNDAYGDPEDNFADIAALWNIQFAHLLASGKSFSANDVAQAMIGVKMARARTSPERFDHWVDIAGYAACGAQCAPTGQ